MYGFVPADEEDDANATAPVVAPTPQTALEKFQQTGSPLGAEDPELQGDQYGFVPAEPEVPKDRAHILGIEAPALQPISDMAAGFNEMLARLTGTAIDDIDLIMRDIGTGGFLTLPGDGVEVVQSAMEKAGMAADSKKAVSDFAANIGKATFQQLLMTGALFAAAPMMAAAQGTTVGGLIQREMGQFMLKHPAATLAAEGGAVVGGEVGTELGGPVGGVLGSMIGGVTAGSPKIIEGMKGAAKGAAKAVLPGVGVGAALGGPEGGAIGAALAAPIGLVRGAIRGATTGAKMRTAREAIPDTPLVTAPGAPDRLKVFAQEAVEGDTMRIDNSIMNEINKVRKIPDPLRAAEVLRNGLVKSFKQARLKESGLWSKVDLKRPVHPKGLAVFAREMRKANSRFAPDSIPGEYLARIGAMAKQHAKKPITIADMRAFRGEILAELRQHIPNDALRRNLTLLEGEVLKQIETAYPDDKAMKTASEFTRWLHRRFTKGPVGSFIRRETGKPLDQTDPLGDMTDPGRAMEAMIRREKSGKAIRNISQTLDIPALRQEAADWVENQFRQVADGLDARAAGEGQKWLKRPEVRRFVKAFPDLSAKLQTTYANLSDLLDERKILERSAFMKFAQEEPQTAVARVMSSKNKVAAAKELRMRFADDPDAYAAWKSAIVEDLFRSPTWNPKNIQARLNTRDMKAFMHAALGHEDAVRLYRNVDDAAQLYRGQVEAGLSTKLFNRGTSIFGRIIAAKLGNRLGGGDIQTPGLLASAAGRTVDNLLAVVPPDVLLARAMTDPHWERVLFARVPRNLKEAERLNVLVSRAVSAMEASRIATEDVTNFKDDE